MDAQQYLNNFLISALITFLIILIPYIITRIVTRGRIEYKTAKIITITYSVISFLIFLVIGFLIDSESVSVFPVIIWNTVGYFIIKPKKTLEQNHQNTNFENLQTAGSLNKQNITPTDIDIVPDKIRDILKTDFSLFTENKYALSDTLLFTYYIISYYVSKSTMLEMQRKEFLHHVNNKLLIHATEDYNYQKNEILELWKRRNNYVKNIFLKNDGVLNLSEIVNEFILIYNYDISENKYIEINENTPLILQGFDNSIEYYILAKSFFNTIVGAVSQTVSNPNIIKQTTQNQKNQVQQPLQKSSEAKSNIMNEELLQEEKKARKHKIKYKHKKNKIVIALSVTTAIFGLATIGLPAGIIYQCHEIYTMNEELVSVSRENGNLENKLERSELNANSYFKDRNELQAELYAYHKYAVCVNNNSTYYHTPNCEFLDKRDFNIYSRKEAKSRGYKECPYCF